MTGAERDGAGTDARRPRLLIADDDPVVRAALTAELTGFRVVALAKDATEAIELAERYRPDLALLDVDMPGGGAHEAVRRIALCSPRTAMVILSADETRSDVVDLLNAGAVAYRRKGATAAELSLALRDALRAADGAGAQLSSALTTALQVRAAQQSTTAGLSARAPGYGRSSTTAR
jgi:two-component system, NarL family, nitrate/nitrite response regulator NarL